jgi:glycerophosphoryl diester phosphodiesterase
VAKYCIAHRGASAAAPEHTLEAYTLALERRAEYVEQDLAVTRDGVLVCLHDDTLERTSDVTQIFPNRFTRSARLGDMRRHWHVNDFTLAEIRRLDMGSWFGEPFAGSRIVTWQEAIDLVRGRAGLFPELKSPALYAARGIDVVSLFIESVRRNGLSHPASIPATPLTVQSFDANTIRRLREELPDVPGVLLVGDSIGGRARIRRLAAIATFAAGIGPAKTLIDERPDLVRRAHEAGLTVAPFTFRAGRTGRFRDVAEEMAYYLYDLDVDALFTDNPEHFPRFAPAA